MWKKTIPGTVSIACLSAAALAGAITPPVAHAATPASLSIDGDLQLAPGLRLLNIDAKGDRTAAGATTGTYVATVMNGRSKTPFQILGPVTCIDTGKNVASLVYPIAGTAPQLVPAGLREKFAVKITVRTGDTDHVGVQGPAPTSSFRGCAPGPTPFVFDGDIAIE